MVTAPVRVLDISDDQLPLDDRITSVRYELKKDILDALQNSPLDIIVIAIGERGSGKDTNGVVAEHAYDAFRVSSGDLTSYLLKKKELNATSAYDFSEKALAKNPMFYPELILETLASGNIPTTSTSGYEIGFWAGARTVQDIETVRAYVDELANRGKQMKCVVINTVVDSDDVLVDHVIARRKMTDFAKDGDQLSREEILSDILANRKKFGYEETTKLADYELNNSADIDPRTFMKMQAEYFEPVGKMLVTAPAEITREILSLLRSPNFLIHPDSAKLYPQVIALVDIFSKAGIPMSAQLKSLYEMGQHQN
ncbi:MAG: hypothetical protein ABIC95_03675 [archaeon]